MNAPTRADQLREASNPLFNDSIPAPALQNLKEHFIAGWVGYPLIGTKDCIVLTWPRYVEDMKRFRAETFPLLQRAGLR